MSWFAGLDGDDHVIHHYLYGPAVDQVLADEYLQPTSGTLSVRWPLADHLGTVRDLIEYDSSLETTELVNHTEFDSFGNLLAESNPDADQLQGYTGREWDADAELYYYRARWYDPVVGRFVSTDPIGFDGGDVNLYRYVSNNVLNATDPSGLRPQLPTDNFLDDSIEQAIMSGVWDKGTALPSPPKPISLPMSDYFAAIESSNDSYYDRSAEFEAAQRNRSDFITMPGDGQKIEIARAAGRRLVSQRAVPGLQVGKANREHYGKIAREYQDIANTTTSPFRAFTATVNANLARANAFVGGFIGDTLFPQQDPWVELTYDDGSRTIVMGAGLSTGDMANQALPLTPLMKTSFLGRARLAPKSVGHYTDFADEAAEIMNYAARSRGLNPNAGVRAMAAPIQEVDLSKLVPPPTRQFADPGKLQRLGPFDMSKYRPIQVEDLGGGRYMIMDGMTRAEAARRAGLTKLPVQIFPKSGP